MQAEVRILMQMVISRMRWLEGSLNDCDDIGTGGCSTGSGARGEGSTEQMRGANCQQSTIC